MIEEDDKEVMLYISFRLSRIKLVLGPWPMTALWAGLTFLFMNLALHDNWNVSKIIYFILGGFSFLGFLAASAVAHVNSQKKKEDDND